MKATEYRQLDSNDLAQKEKALKKELFDLNQQRQAGAVEKPSRFKQVKKDIARILTILKERDIEHERDATKTK